MLTIALTFLRIFRDSMFRRASSATNWSSVCGADHLLLRGR
jgi:hypothetical protein